jgi:hypothetical protein
MTSLSSAIFAKEEYIMRRYLEISGFVPHVFIRCLGSIREGQRTPTCPLVTMDALAAYGEAVAQDMENTILDFSREATADFFGRNDDVFSVEGDYVTLKDGVTKETLRERFNGGLTVDLAKALLAADGMTQSWHNTSTGPRAAAPKPEYKVYQFYLPIGDWSDDGHGRCQQFLVNSNAPVERVREAHFRIKETTGIDIESICGGCEENTISPDVSEKIAALGIPFEPGEDGQVFSEDMAHLWGGAPAVGRPRTQAANPKRNLYPHADLPRLR